MNFKYFKFIDFFINNPKTSHFKKLTKIFISIINFLKMVKTLASMATTIITIPENQI